MAVPEGPTDKRYIGNGVTKTFTIPFLLLAATDLDVFIDGIEVISGFTVTSVGYPTSTLAFAVAPDDQADIYLQLDVPFERLNDYQENGDFLSSTVNRDFDRIWQALKQLLRWAGRSLRLGYFDVDGRGWYRAKGNGIRDLHDPVNSQDAVTKKYADELTLDTTQYTDTQMLRTVRVANGETLTQLPSVASRANKVMGFDAAGQPIGVLPASGSGTELAIDLANPTKGSGMVGHLRAPLALAIEGTVAKILSQAQVDIWEFSYLVTERPVPDNFGTWDWTLAFEAARVTIGALGGGSLTFGTGGVYQALEIQHDRSIVFDGRGVQSTEIKQMAGANRDFIKCENFDILKESGLNVDDQRVPSWYGLRDIRVNGNRYREGTNPTGNTIGKGVQYYGPSLLMIGTVLIYETADVGFYTEDSTNATGSSWRAQEEGKFDNVLVMDCGGIAGWHCRGPHNNSAKSIVCGRNDGWNFYSEEGATFGGSFDNIGMLHSYAGGRGTIPAGDTGIYLGGIARIDNLVIDGDNLVVQSNEIQIDKLRAYNIGGYQDGIVINGHRCQINSLNGTVWGSSVDRTAIVINGTDAVIKGTLIANNPNNDALHVKNTGHTIDLTIRNFFGEGRTAIKLEATDCDISAKIRNCKTAFDYVSGTDNQVNLSIQTSAGQTAVKGLAPRLGDRINIRSRGNTIGGCKTNLLTPPISMDISTYTIVTVKHGLLYTPPPGAVRLNWVTTEPDSSAWDEALLRVVFTTQTDIVIGYKLATAAPAGTQARIGISIDLT